MTDDLRTRIAAAIRSADPELWDWLDEMECTTTSQTMADVLARFPHGAISLPLRHRLDR